MRTGLIATLLIAATAITGVLAGGKLIAAPAERSATANANANADRGGIDQARVNRTPAGQDRGPSADGNAHRDMLSPAEIATAVKGGLLPAGVKSLLKTDGQMRHGEYIWDEAGAPAGKLLVWVDLRTQLVSVFRGGHEIGTAVVVYGAETMKSPIGDFPILSKRRDYHSRAYDAPMPYSLFITKDGVALHGCPMSRRRATHGCIGLPEEFAARLFETAKVGDEVRIIRSISGPAPVSAPVAGS